MAGEIQIGGTTFATESGGTVTVSNVDSATNRTNLGLGSMATQDANAVALTGGSLTGTEIDLKSSGTTIYKSDGTTGVIAESSGDVSVTAKNFIIASGGGINFSSTSDSSATGASLDTNGEILDEYEEGSYTATISASTSGTITLKSTANKLEYVKIGRMIFVNGTIQVDSVSSPTGEPELSLPFTATSAGNYGRQGAGFVGISDLAADAVNVPITQIIGSASTVLIRDIGFSATGSFSFAAKIDADTFLNVSLMYKAI